MSAESLSTLKFANRAKNMRNLPKVNEDLDHRTLLRKYERELRKLRAELQQKSKDLVDKRLVLQVMPQSRCSVQGLLSEIQLGCCQLSLVGESQRTRRHCFFDCACPYSDAPPCPICIMPSRAAWKPSEAIMSTQRGLQLHSFGW